MAPKRKDKDSETAVKQKPDVIQADNEIFLQAFESELHKEYKQKPLLEKQLIRT